MEMLENILLVKNTEISMEMLENILLVLML